MSRRSNKNKDREPAVYQKIMSSLLDRIEQGEFGVGDQIPSEHQLVTELGVSRMTVNRALTELAAQGYLNRVQGVGSFVADARPHSSLLDVPDIAADIQRRGHTHRAEVLALCERLADAEIAAALEVQPQEPVFHSELLHFEEGHPVLLEERYVREDFAADYLQQDFTAITPYHFLMRQGRIQEVEHTLHAAASEVRQSQLLQLSSGEPCLVLTRRTWSDHRVVTFGRFYYAGNRYRLFSHYSPQRFQ